jgi:hypothetical protein
MRIYLDDDSAAQLLARLLRQAGHEVQIPADVGLLGEDDAVHLTHAVKDDRVLLTGNHRDFLNLHNLVMQVCMATIPAFLWPAETTIPNGISPHGVLFEPSETFRHLISLYAMSMSF